MKYKVRNRGSSYFVDFTTDEGKRFRVTLDAHDQKTADKVAFDTVIKTINQPKIIKAIASNARKALTIEDCLKAYIVHLNTDPEYRRTPAYIRMMSFNAKRLVKGTGSPGSFGFGDRLVSSITNSDILALKKSRAKYLKMGTISHELRLLRAALNHARFDGYEVPFVKISVPQNEQRQRHFSPQEFKGLYDYLNPVARGYSLGTPNFRAYLNAQHLVLFLRETGMRIGEAGTVKFEDIDFKSGCIKVLTAKQKTPHYRFVPLPPILAAAMKARMETARAYDPIGYMSALVFSSGYDLKRFQCRLISRAITALGYNAGKVEPLCVHSLRHSFASESLKTGLVSLVDMKELLGHSSIKTTEIYAHFVPAETIAKALRIPSSV